MSVKVGDRVRVTMRAGQTDLENALGTVEESYYGNEEVEWSIKVLLDERFIIRKSMPDIKIRRVFCKDEHFEVVDEE